MNGHPTKRQADVLDFIRRYIAEQKRSPSLEEIGAGLRVRSLATIHKHVSNLSEKGLLTWRWGHSRSIQVTDCCPACGREFDTENQAKSA